MGKKKRKKIGRPARPTPTTSGASLKRWSSLKKEGEDEMKRDMDLIVAILKYVEQNDIGSVKQPS